MSSITLQPFSETGKLTYEGPTRSEGPNQYLTPSRAPVFHFLLSRMPSPPPACPQHTQTSELGLESHHPVATAQMPLIL